MKYGLTIFALLEQKNVDLFGGSRYYGYFCPNNNDVDFCDCPMKLR